MSPIANSSEEYWSIDNVSLHQFGWSVATFGGARYDLPPRRGENLRLAYRPGAVPRPKLMDSRTITLLMWVTGADPATGAPATDPRLRFNDSWDTLRRLVWKPAGVQVTLTRRWWLTVAGTPALLAADADAEIADTMTPTMTGRTRADFAMNLLLADGFFYGTQQSATAALSTPTTVDNPGHDLSCQAHLAVDLVGPLTNPTLTNSSTSPHVWFTYHGTIGSGRTVFCDIGAFVAKGPSTTAPGTPNLVGKISHAGSRYWMVLAPGTNTLTLTADSGTGHAAVRFRPPYV